MIPEAMHLGFIFLWTMWSEALQSAVGGGEQSMVIWRRERNPLGFQSLILGRHYGEISFPVKAVSLFIDGNMNIVR